MIILSACIRSVYVLKLAEKTTISRLGLFVASVDSITGSKCDILTYLPMYLNIYPPQFLTGPWENNPLYFWDLSKSFLSLIVSIDTNIEMVLNHHPKFGNNFIKRVEVGILSKGYKYL